MTGDTGALLGAIEAGGTKFVLAVGRSPDDISARHEIPTRRPEETFAAAARWFEDQGALSAIGIASFGPVQLDRAADNWGHILGTPKPGWSQCDIAGFFADRFQVPVAFDTDVNGAALGEYRFGAGRGARSMAYVTVGTGIGGGMIVNDQIVHGVSHPEMGHFYPRRAKDDRSFAGACPFHGDCLEGLASGPAILSRWGKTLSDLPEEHEAHELVGGYLGQLCHTLFAVCAAETVVIGGGVMQTPGLLDRVSAAAGSLDNDYLPGTSRHKILSPHLGNNAGITGALLLADAIST